MKGLYAKDLRLLAKQKLFFFVTIFLTVLNAYNLESLAIAPALMLFFFVMLIFSTVTYDEMNHGLSFLFTLPVSRKKYVTQKYSLALAGAIIALLLSVAIIVIMASLQDRKVDFETLGVTLGGLFISGIVYISLMMPVYLKFGEAKSRIIMIIIIGIIFFCIFLGSSLIERFDINIQGLIQRISDIPLWLLLSAGAGTSVVFCVISYFLSLRIINKKEL